MMRGSDAEASPLDEVWHWLAASERLTRTLSFFEQEAVCKVLASVIKGGGQEANELSAKWESAVRQLRQAQRESSWNSDYLRVVMEPLGRLGAEETLRSGALPRVVKALMRSLHQIYCTSAFFKEHRMAALLHKILKVLIAQTAHHLVPMSKIAAPAEGFRGAVRVADLLQNSFQAFADHYFIVETSVSSPRKAERRPATALGTAADRTITMSSASLRRKDTNGLGLWRATVRHALQHAEHCRAICSRISSLLLACSQLVGALPALSTVSPGLTHSASGFLHLHSGLADGLGTAEALDLRQQATACTRLDEIEERLSSLLAQVEVTGVPLAQTDSLTELSGLEPRIAQGGTAEVLTLPGAEVVEQVHDACQLQECITSMNEEMRSFGAELETLSQTIAQRGRMAFAPPPRVLSSMGNCNGAMGTQAVDCRHANDMAAGLEVAKRSNWYKEPPPLLPDNVPLLEVRQKITQTTIHRCPSRPRTAQPRLFVTRAATDDENFVSNSSAAATEDTAGDESLITNIVVGESVSFSVPPAEEPNTEQCAGDSLDTMQSLGVSWRIT